MIARTLQVLAPFAAAPMIVVGPPRAERLRAELRGYSAILLSNALRGEGLSSSVRRGLRHTRYEAAVLLVPMDLAQLNGRDVSRLIARWRGARRRVTARRIGTEAAAPLILPRRLYPLALGITGDVGLKMLIRHLPPAEISLLSMPSAAFDVDTARDLNCARRHARPRAR